MAHLRRISLLLALAVAVSESMHIPEDMEILDGYDLESAGTEINPEDDFYEQRSLLEPFFSRAIRDKREVPYRVLESPGLRSHFRPSYYEDISKKPDHQRTEKRSRRSVEKDEAVSTTEDPKSTDEQPKAEKQTMHQRTIEAWGKTPYQVKQSAEDELDSEPEASMMNEGIKARAPRVNFITQKKPKGDSSEQREDKVIPELYRKPLARLYYEYPTIPRMYDSFPAHSQSPMYPKIYNKYDEYHRDMMDRMHPPAPHRYDMYYQRRYDSDYDTYFPRYSFPGYYYYPDKRFDVPSYYRDRNYLLSNDVMDSPSPVPQIHLPPRTRRIIYYANLPEIVRTPPNVDLRYRNYNKFGNRFDPFYPTKAPMGSYKASSTIKYDERNPGDRKEDKYVSSTPIKIVREIAAQQESPGVGNSAGRRQYSVNGGGGGGGSSGRSNSYSDGGHHELDRSYFSRYH
ncbi:uncharacterized protein LOC131430486 [Malaya genurostris]|uniref:uncharacterized protein LOC131430486 n=1 Tax=Malaya genurostris TaxID=325434 RepID=UPI0026F3C9AA|nr:uncharacterized protein LOC131430486 [Malaya genurostris]XP_058451498.1 uncharacterized protein LOC131430486 [Malaya genurostris]XP_058451499.1 uncharacterized protein LOC131430486 [Malaya genurostris]